MKMMQMFAAASSASGDTHANEMARFVCFFLAQAGSLTWTLWIVGKLNFVKSMVERKVEGARAGQRARGGSVGSDGCGAGRVVGGKVWNVRRQSKDDVLFGHVEWRGPEFYLNSMKLLVSSSIVSLTFGASLFSEHLGALNLVVALSLAPSMLAIAQTPTIINMYKCASAASTAAPARQEHARCSERPHADALPLQDDCGRLRGGMEHGEVVQGIVRDLGSAVRIASKQVTRDVNWATAGAATAAFVLVAIQAAAYNMHNDVLTTVFMHARHDVMHNEWVRDAMMVLGAVEDLPIVLRDNLENMFPRIKPLIKISPVVTRALAIFSAVQFAP
jgi:hypothetical protein